MIKRLQLLLESKFGFWLVTTLLVSTVTISHAYLQNSFSERQRRQTLLERLDLEIEYRLSQFMTGVAQVRGDKPATLRGGYTAEDVKALTQILVGPPKPHKDIAFFSMFPQEFGARPLTSLLAEAASLRPGRARRYKEQIAYLSGGSLLLEHGGKARDFLDVMKLASEVNRELIFESVSGEFFYYTDCPPTSPLC